MHNTIQMKISRLQLLNFYRVPPLFSVSCAQASSAHTVVANFKKLPFPILLRKLYLDSSYKMVPG